MDAVGAADREHPAVLSRPQGGRGLDFAYSRDEKIRRIAQLPSESGIEDVR